jgi:glycosyltransferase involved in cell wall biosynthesis
VKGISIILPVYNGVPYLQYSVQSVLAQSYTAFELLIVDDCSTDGSWQYLNDITDSRVKLYRNERNMGLFFNLNFLIGQSETSIIKLWSQDDILYENCIGQVVSFHNKHPQIGFSYTARHYIDSEGNSIDIDPKDDTPEIVSSQLHARIAFFTGSIAGNIANVAINRNVLNEVGLFNEQMKISGDFEMWIRLARKHPVGFIREPLVQLRNHKGQLSGRDEYYIFHLKEDIIAYHILLGYVNDQQRQEGRVLLRNHKLLFYYTLMIKALLSGQIKTALEFCRRLHSFDNIFLLTGSFIKNKLLQRKAAYVSKDQAAVPGPK